MSDGIERARALTLRYLLASTAIFFAAGVLGLLLRTSQADLGRLDPNFFYAVMTAHGLGAFVGWAGFACMGLSLWVLASVGFPLRRLGAALAEAAFWLMLAGVGGILVTTLLLNFGGSWVFLYPLPFHPAGQWGDATTGFFSASVLVVGLSIIAWCVCILHTVLSPALHAVRPTILNRLGLALGFGYLAPRRFATNPTPVPYAVIPLTVIGIDMIIATLPLAVLLVIMIVQSAAPGVSVDPLLAKNMLWFFGHPVVYLLLFPAVAVYYLLIPRYAKRPLVAALERSDEYGTGVQIESRRVRTRLFGEHDASNVVGAITAASLLGADIESVLRAIPRLTGARGRMQRVAAVSVLAIVDYAHTPNSLSRVLANGRRLRPSGKLIVVGGCGGDRDASKRAAMGTAIATADVPITADNPSSEADP